MYAKLNDAQINLLKLLRDQPDEMRKQIKADLFKQVKNMHGIPDDHKLKVEIDNQWSPDYAVLIRKKDGAKYQLTDTGRWVGASVLAPAAPVDPRRWVFVTDSPAAVLRDWARDNCTEDDVLHPADDVDDLDRIRANSGEDYAITDSGVYVFMDPADL